MNFKKNPPLPAQNIACFWILEKKTIKRRHIEFLTKSLKYFFTFSGDKLEQHPIFHLQPAAQPPPDCPGCPPTTSSTNTTATTVGTATTTTSGRQFCHPDQSSKYFRYNWICLHFIRDLRDKIMTEKVMYIPNDETQNYLFFRLKLVVETFKHST